MRMSFDLFLINMSKFHKKLHMFLPNYHKTIDLTSFIINYIFQVP
jgi:hypothetical protein